MGVGRVRAALRALDGRLVLSLLHGREPPAAPLPEDGATDVLREPHSALVGRALVLLSLFALGVVLLAVPGPYLREWRLIGLALVAIGTAAPPVLRRIRHGGFQLAIYADHFWFSSRLGDATVPWSTCGPFRVHFKQTDNQRSRGRGLAISKGVDFSALIERQPTPPWRLPHRRGGIGWEANAQLASRYGMTAEAVASILNRHRDAVLAEAASQEETADRDFARAWGQDATWSRGAPSPYAPGLQLIARILVPIVLVVGGFIAVDHGASGTHNSPQTGCAGALDAIKDAAPQIVGVLGETGTSTQDLAQLETDIQRLGTAADESSGAAATAISTVRMDLVALRADVAADPTDSSGTLEDDVEVYLHDMQMFDNACDVVSVAPPS